MRQIFKEKLPRLSKNNQIYSAHHGFTLIELIVVIAITGILAAGAVMFIRNPMQAYLDIEARATLTDLADNALRRMSRAIETSLPNSVRVTTSGADSMVEFIPIKNAGRYRADVGSPDTRLPDDPLDFDASMDSFDVLGPSIGACSPCTSELVIFNLGIAGADAYEGSNRRTISSIVTDTTWTESKITFTGSLPFPLASPDSRFYIVDAPQTYACDMTNGQLLRFEGYGFQLTQTTSIAALATLAGSFNKTLLAEKLSYCKITYNETNQRNGVVSIAVAFANNGANMRLMHQVRVMNSP